MDSTSSAIATVNYVKLKWQFVRRHKKLNSFKVGVFRNFLALGVFCKCQGFHRFINNFDDIEDRKGQDQARHLVSSVSGFRFGS